MIPLQPLRNADPTRRGMVGSIIEGCFYQVWFGAVSGNFLTAMALYLGAGGLALGLLGATPHMATMLQLVSAPLVAGLQQRRLWIAIFSAVQRFGGAIAGLLALAFAPAPWALTLFVALQVFSWAFMAPAVLIWHGYMSDLVPAEVRGRYFARRNAFTTTAATLAVLAYGRVLDHWPAPTGFQILYVCALLGAVLNVGAYGLTPELLQSAPRSSRPFWETLRVPLRRPGAHRAATFFFSAWAFAQGLAVPFFPLALMQRLGLSFVEVSVLATMTSLTTVVSVGFLGRLQDRIGEGKVITMLTGMLACVPALFLLAGWGGWAALVPAHILLGVAQGGLHLSSQTLNLRLAPAEDRSSFYAFYAVGGGLAGFLTPILAGPLTEGYLSALFAASSLVSAGLALLWHRRLRPLVG